MSAPLGPEVAEARNIHLNDAGYQYELDHLRDNPQSKPAEKKPAEVVTPEVGGDAAKGSPATTLVDTEISEEEKPKGLAFMLIISMSSQYLLAIPMRY
jgi:hypothetical protein